MDLPCHNADSESAGYLASLRRTMISHGLPMTGSMDLTARCNLRCIHCYVAGDPTPHPAHLPADAACRILSHAASAGCLSVLLTGGEPLLHEEFPRIYQHAKSLGLFVTVFTNATRVTPALVDLFRELPPRSVEVSLYGATAATYEQVTRVPGSFAECLRGIGLLTGAGFPLRIKTVLMKLNRHELPALRALAARHGAAFHFDASICPTLEGDPAPLAQRVEPEEAVAMEFADPDRAAQWREAHGRWKPPTHADAQYLCGAGVTGFHVDAAGWMRPCMMIPWIHYALINGDFASGWEYIRSRMREQHARTDTGCFGCDRKNLCGYCPAFFRLETGSESVKSNYLCEIGRSRLDRIERKMV